MGTVRVATAEDSRCGARNKLSQTGFTLLEVLLTLVVLGMIMAQVGPKYGSSILSSQAQALQASRVRIEGAVELYRLDTGAFPNRLEDLLSAPPGGHGWRGPYLDQLPTQPDGRPFTLDAQGNVGI